MKIIDRDKKELSDRQIAKLWRIMHYRVAFERVYLVLPQSSNTQCDIVDEHDKIITTCSLEAAFRL